MCVIQLSNFTADFLVVVIEFLPPANEVWGKVIFLHQFVILFTGGGHACVVTPGGGMHGCSWGGMRGCLGGMCGCSRGVCVVLLGGYAWFYSGHVWFYLGGMRGFILGGMCGFIWGACMVLFGGHAWFYLGGMRGFIQGGCAWFFQFFWIQ